jgi:hypothetical protein
MSGRGAGFCAGFGVSSFANGAPGRVACYAGGGQGRGGRGNRNWRHRTGLFGWQRGGASAYGSASVPTWTKDDEIQALKDELQGFEKATEQIRTRLTELEKAP